MGDESKGVLALYSILTFKNLITFLSLTICIKPFPSGTPINTHIYVIYTGSGRSKACLSVVGRIHE